MMSSSLDQTIPSASSEDKLPTALPNKTADLANVTALLREATLESKPFQDGKPIWVDTPAELSDAVDALDGHPAVPPPLFVDLEGVNLSRQGTISILQIYVLPIKTTYLIDIHILKDKAFATAGKNGKTLKHILESATIPKVFFDVRNDSDALYSHYHISLAGIQDLQLMELATRRYPRRFVSGLAKCIEKDAPLSVIEMAAWKTTKAEGVALFAPEKGGSYEVFNERPLSQKMLAYCVSDVLFLPRLWSLYQRKLTPALERKVIEGAKGRVALSQREDYNGKGRHMALPPPGCHTLSSRYTMPQPPVSPLPEDLNLGGKVAIVTGATAGLGLEFSRQLLECGISRLVLAVRNVSKGEDVRKQLLAEATISKRNPDVHVEIMKLDTASYQSVKEFAKGFKDKYERLDILMLNAGIGFQTMELTVDGHESTIQINFLSNVLLFFELLPILESTPSSTGRQPTVSATGSRMHLNASLRYKQPPPAQSVLQYLDDPNKFAYTKRYADSKFVLSLFLLQLSQQYSPESVVFNQFCPGFVSTDLSAGLPFYLEIVANFMKRFMSRKLQLGGWVGLHAATVAGPESHGQLLHDKDLVELSPDDFVLSSAGQKLQQQIWNETLQEMRVLTNLPTWATPVN
ncbi:Short-chain dehydrogenase/reductase SDR [Paramyrothecium foliicola]|nr:Short-chain dehydrogenase/reductase SDR [Paramyrothecium foliicola]